MKLAASLRAAAGRIAMRDVSGLAGCALVSAGAGEIYRPAGLIVGGLILLAGALLTAKKPG